MKKKLKILAAGDIHGDSSLANQLARRATKEKVDLVILAGDLTVGDQPPKGIISPFTKKNKKVLLIPGNHDSFATADFLAELYGVKNIHGYSVKYEDVGIFGCSAVNIGMHQIPETEIFDLLKKGYNKIKYLKKKIMVTHTPPTKTKMEKLSHAFMGTKDLDVASKGVEKAVKKFKPDLLICSHLHEAEGIEEILDKTLVVNVGRKGRIIEI
tara:strand:+ start:299 stop:934 length:636 start_codon:yes stop_codon:yes gene_type:complete